MSGGPLAPPPRTLHLCTERENLCAGGGAVGGWPPGRWPLDLAEGRATATVDFKKLAQVLRSVDSRASLGRLGMGWGALGAIFSRRAAARSQSRYPSVH
eukprot:CAMPEP_0206313430 /NCGR_PEP_ID=MMETSP0106_2-20121207/14499_1 /ASSEMBLY_ACC=CAM_ASM_000206 /TAXON_ID=81532 /ORGANISM="Acanthoeca-like sp., Strain 10tr" /LENGTH=98 /DNA_ID=CAMNT_0053744757 /DNA_START=41 /DNA_END=337 /DNA_ORIENTATION=+